MHFWRWPIVAGALVVLAAAAPAQAQPAPGQPQSFSPDSGSAFLRFFEHGEWYFSIGTNEDYWAPTDITVSQPSLGNNFTIYSVHGHDDPAGGDEAPQYNIRVGRFLTENFGIEFSLDHTKYFTNVGQTAQSIGTIGGMPVNVSTQLTNTYFSEGLHNGANHVMVDAVYRFPLIGKTNETLSVAGIVKAGVGVMLPHTSDTILGNPVDVGTKSFGNLIGFHNGWWQFNGWTTGAELGFRVVLFKPVYLELTDKVAYSYFGDLPAYQGTLQQSLWMNEVILSLGFTYDGTSR